MINIKERDDKLENKKDTPLKNPLVVALLSLFSCFLWGSAFPAIKVGYDLFDISASDTYSKIVFAGYRFFLAGVMIFLFCIFTGKSLKLKGHQMKKVFTLGIMQTTINYAFFYIGVSNTSGTIGSIIMGTNTLFAIIIARFFYNEDKLTWKKILGLFLGFSGVILVNINGGNIGGGFSLTGEGFVLLASLTGAISSVYTKRVARDIDSFLVAGYQLFLGSIFLLLAGFAGGGEALKFTSQNIGLLLYLAFVSAAGFSMWTSLLKYNPVGKVAIYKFTVPLFGVILSYIILNERLLGARVILSVILVSTSIIFINLDRKRGHKLN